MLTCPQFHHHSPLLHHRPLRRHPNFTTVTITPPTFFSTISCSSSNHKPSQTPQITTTTTNSSQDDPKRHLRKHNAKSTSFLLHNLPPNTESQTHEPEHHRNDIAFPEEDKIKLLELSLTTDRIPLFPGSVYTHYSTDANFDSPPVNLVIKDDEKEEEEGGGEMIMRAIEIRRKVTREIFKQQMRRSKFGITYVENMVDELSEFLDYVMIEAAKMKGLEEFSQSSFNVRARTVIEDSGAVPLIR